MYVEECFSWYFCDRAGVHHFRTPRSAVFTRAINHLWNYQKIFSGRAIYHALISCCHGPQVRGDCKHRELSIGSLFI